jgi:hypothetical protein
MSDRIKFEIVCPNDHDQTVVFSQEEFEKALKSGAGSFRRVPRAAFRVTGHFGFLPPPQ